MGITTRGCCSFKGGNRTWNRPRSARRRVLPILTSGSDSRGTGFAEPKAAGEREANLVVSGLFQVFLPQEKNSPDREFSKISQKKSSIHNDYPFSFSG